MRLSEALSSIEQRWKCVDGLPCVAAQTGELYEQVTTAGVGMGIRGMTLPVTPESAVLQWYNNLMRYAGMKRGTLYWRVRPELDQIPDDDSKPVWRVYSRLLISDKPALYETYEQWRAANPETKVASA